MEKQNFESKTLQSLTIHIATVEDELGYGFSPVPMGEFGHMTLLEFQNLIELALTAEMLVFYELGDNVARELVPIGVSGNGPAVQISFRETK